MAEEWLAWKSAWSMGNSFGSEDRTGQVGVLAGPGSVAGWGGPNQEIN